MRPEWRWIVVVLNVVGALSPVIKIGALFTEDERGGSEELAFKYSVYRINKERSVLANSTLVYDIQYAPAKDTFKTYKRACSQVKSGAVALFSSGGDLLGSTLDAICRSLHAPHMLVAPQTRPTLSNESFTINLYPPRGLLNEAFGDLIGYLNWTRMGVLYEDFGYGDLSILDIAKDGRDMYAVRCVDPKDYRKSLIQLKAQRIKNVIVDTDPARFRQLARAILQLQMNSEEYHYIFTSFDMELFDLEDFYYNRVNMSGWRLVDRDSDKVKDALQVMEKFHPIGASILSGGHIRTAPALLYDAVQVLALAMSSTELVQTKNVSCDKDSPWPHGRGLLENINTVQAHGLTGPIQLKDGIRTNFSLQLMRLSGGETGGTVLAGEWRPGEGLVITDPAAYRRDPPPNVTLTVVTVEEKPYVMVKEGWNLQGNARFEGFCIDLLARVAARAGFHYRLRLVPDNMYGARDPETGQWNGIVRELMDRKADIAVASMTINYAREAVIDFTKPFMNLGIGILFKVPTSQPTRLFSFLNPLAIEIWLYVLAAYVLVSFTLFVMARFSPYEWSTTTHVCGHETKLLTNQFSVCNSFWFITGTFLRQGSGLNPKVPTSQPTRLFSFLNPLAIEIWLYVLAAYVLVSFTLFVMARFSPYEWSTTTHVCGHETKLLTNQFSVCNSFWFITGTFLRQGSGLNPKATSTRIVGGIWWFFTLIILSSYTANLAAFLTVDKTVLPIQSAADLAAQSTIQYGTLNGGSTMSFFRDSNIDIYKRMWQQMSTASPPALVSSYEEGVRKVLTENYAFLMESTMLDHRVQRDCNLTQIGGLLDSKGYGIATWKGSPWRDKISLAILELQEKGVIQILYDKWWKNTGDVCNRDGKDSKANPLGVQNIGGVFVTLLCGLALSIVVAILEFCWNTRKNASQGRQSLCSEMGQELRTAMRGRSSSRTVLRPGCSRCSPNTHVPPAPSRYEIQDGGSSSVELKELRWS
ncbi:glutamate receptor ionotropic, kainate 2 isoform X2 [Bombyx mandarina]|uniref:Glutamate receptor ionotropic, kainate 2 isoform X2 n=1 Tax=Bombyx mandarina TaxID=7092 RepID=A0A6J2K223_BOMMA|nr:glutamate receptor ionotropic, kainate 2 isoform X2 [Bombyx mandarina]